MLKALKIADIIVGRRHRKDMGCLTSLVGSKRLGCAAYSVIQRIVRPLLGGEAALRFAPRCFCPNQNSGVCKHGCLTGPQGSLFWRDSFCGEGSK